MDLTLVHAGPWAGWWRVSAPNKASLQYIKYSVPKIYRNLEDQVWFVHEKYIDGVRQLQDEQTTKITSKVISDPYAVLHLRPTAPPAIIKAAWRELAKLLHPDHGGNSEEFLRAKEAYEILTTKG